MAKSKPIRAREELVRNQPTFYSFHFKDVPPSKYTETLEVLFHDPDYDEAVERHNRFVQSLNRLRPGSSEMVNLERIIQQHERKLADIMFSVVAQTNLYSEVHNDFFRSQPCLNTTLTTARTVSKSV